MEHSTAQYCTILHNTALHTLRDLTQLSNSTAQYISVHSRYTPGTPQHYRYTTALQIHYSTTTDYRSLFHLALPTPYLDRAIATRTKESSPSPCQFLNFQIPQLLLYSYVWACLSIPSIVYARVNKILSPIDTERASQLGKTHREISYPHFTFCASLCPRRGTLLINPYSAPAPAIPTPDYSTTAI
jgi:hypothetical protein